MPKYERMEDLPPVIQRLLKERGWTYPPSKEMKREWREARERLDGAFCSDPEVLEMRYEEDRPSWWVKLKSDPERYRRWKEEATKRYQEWKKRKEQEKEQGNAR